MASRKRRVGIIGAGGIGSVVAGFLDRAGYDVTLIDAWHEHIDACATRGLTVRTAQGEEFVSHPAAVHLQDLQALNETFDIGMVAVNAYDTTWATACLDRFVARDGVMCCFQNGVNDEDVAAVAGRDRHGR